MFALKFNDEIKNIIERMNKVDDGLVYFFRETVKKTGLENSPKKDQLEITCFSKDKNGSPYVGWIDKNGNKVIIEDKVQVIRVDELPVSNGDESVVYIYKRTQK